MREEFLLAAKQYLEVELPVHAAKCLQNAGERELLAHLYEKMGQVFLIDLFKYQYMFNLQNLYKSAN
jgi:UDP-N-acetylglucosamine 2-epimerase